MDDKSFTLIELIVVIAIIAILAAIVAPNAFKAIEKARISGIEGDYRNIKTAAMSYYSDVGGWPANGNTAGFTANDGTSGWGGPYLEKWPQRNAWGGKYYWHNDSTATFAASGINERWVEATSVPSSSANKLDALIDNSNGATGILQYSCSGANAGAVCMEISDDTY